MHFSRDFCDPAPFSPVSNGLPKRLDMSPCSSTVFYFCSMVMLAATTLAEMDPSSKILSRHRRFDLISTAGWTARFDSYARLLIPIQILNDVSVTSRIVFPFSATYNFDSGAVTQNNPSGTLNLGRKRRSSPDHFAAHEMKRYRILGVVENAIREHLGFDGHSCLLRMLCETAQVPSHTEGFMGDAVNMLLTPPYILDQVEVVKNPNEYLAAIRDGKVWDNCSAYTSKCGRSFFKITEHGKVNETTIYNYFGNYEEF